jgi:hypothetical protein
MKTMHKTFLIASLMLATQNAFAQGGDPMREIQEIAESVDEQLKEIDRLLLESGKQDQARLEPKQKLVEAIVRSLTGEVGLDRLFEKLNEMKNQGGGGGGQSDQEPQDGQQQGQQRPQQGQQGNRRENQTHPQRVPQHEPVYVPRVY